ncbi:MAG TPA: CYTH domain-containing protein [Bacteroidales bacterium]|jgi:CYTH domain-containing protein|nr:CYTH domain-containing protein [Bacteroidales bacterium]MBP7874058.1 CYTH domain-containing protein [Bacteroidales bacterium]MCZ2281764.1 CYTH domain-containing protein [Bacteroidales bacterium]HPX33661.1 CYTH domain-containing protein [Bacteroidales bacterium]HQB48315.1 CYTH domain-containing protein [Bacteroidales bacterium]
MGKEIERKFLVLGNFKHLAFNSFRITQGYLNSLPQRSVRIRVKDNKGFITIKGIGNAQGTTRYEWEREMPLSEAEELLKLCEPGIIDKNRFLIKSGDHIIEVDEFYGANQGLVIAEIELNSEDEEFDKPAWLGKEVTGDQRYYNVYLIKNPYSTW